MGEVHYFGPRCDEVGDELLFCVGAAIDFCDGAELRVGAEDEVHGGGGPFDFAGLAVFAFEEMLALCGLLPVGSHVEEAHKEVIGECAGLLGEDAHFRVADVGAEDSQAADEDG